MQLKQFNMNSNIHILQRTKSLACIGCTVGVDVLNELFALGLPTSIMQVVATKICSLALDESVCSGAIANYLVR